MNYQLFTYPQVAPKYITVNGAVGPKTVLNAGPAVTLPTGTLIYKPANYDIYAADPAQRTSLYETTGDGNVSADIFAGCPGLRNWKAGLIRAEGNRRLESVATPYMVNERFTWQDQKSEAIAFQADPMALTPMIDAIAANRGITKAALVGLIMENADLFRPTAGTILGAQQSLLDRIYTVTDIAEFMLIKWD